MQDGKPIVAIWGIDFTHIDISASKAFEMIIFFQNKYFMSWEEYPMVGVTLKVLVDLILDKKLDALSPWAVGRFDDEGVNFAFDNYVIDDKKATNANNQI